MAAFDRSADSLYKKRKSLVTLPGEKAEPDKLRSKARDYLCVIDALVPYSKSSTMDDFTSRRTLLLKFIQGSSYENHTTISDRMTASFKKEINTQLDKVTAKVLRHVALDSMYEWYRNHMPGRGLELQYAGESGAYFGDWETTVPMVRIAEVFTKVPSCSVLQLEVEFEGFDTESPTEVVRAIQLALISTYGSNDDLMARESFDYITKEQAEKTEWTDGLDNSGDFDQVDSYLNYLPKDSDEWSTEYGFYSVRSYVDLELRYLSDWQSWEQFLFWRTGVTHICNGYGDEQVVYEFAGKCALEIARSVDFTLYAKISFHFSGSPVVQLFEVDHFAWEGLEGSTFRGAENLVIHRDLGGEEGAERLDSVLKVSKNEFLFSSAFEDEHHYNSLLVYDGYHQHRGHVPAPSGSFAQLILENLAYAPAQHRIDNLMLADVQAKYAAFEKLAAAKEAEYRKAIASL